MKPANDTLAPPELSVLVPTLDEAEVPPGLLAALHGQQGVRLEVLVADGGSLDATAALAAADAASGWIEAEPCDLAGRVAAEAGAVLAGCAVEGDSGQVRVSVSLQTMLGTAQARSRAGPGVP